MNMDKGHHSRCWTMHPSKYKYIRINLNDSHFPTSTYAFLDMLYRLELCYFLSAGTHVEIHHIDNRR